MDTAPPTAPLLPSPMPAVSVSAPPAALSAVVLPAVTVTAPPAPVLPSPTLREIAPPAPPVALPVSTVNAPVAPEADSPVVSAMSPLTPEEPELAVAIVMEPESSEVPTPLVTLTAPPVDPPLPPVTVTAPPVALPSPPAIDIVPPMPLLTPPVAPVPLPSARVMIPPVLDAAEVSPAASEKPPPSPTSPLPKVNDIDPRAPARHVWVINPDSGKGRAPPGAAQRRFFFFLWGRANASLVFRTLRRMSAWPSSSTPSGNTNAPPDFALSSAAITESSTVFRFHVRK